MIIIRTRQSLDSVLRERARRYYAACLYNRTTYGAVFTYHEALAEVIEAHERTQKRVRDALGNANTTTT